MANNRMFLRHKITGESIVFGRNGGHEWIFWYEDEKSHINDFFEKNIVEDQGGKENYEIVYE
jgi:hypothetical protein